MAEQALKDLVVHAGEELDDVALEYVGITLGEIGVAVQGRVGALTFPAGVGIVDEARLPDGVCRHRS